MVKLRRRRISKRTVDSLPVDGKDAVFWDSALRGFGVRVYPSGAKVYIVQVRSGGKSRRFTLGHHGLISAAEARQKAAHTIGRIKQGEEPALAPSGWAVDRAQAAYTTSARDGPGGTLHGSVVTNLLRPYERPLLNSDRRREYFLGLVVELLGSDWSSPWTRDYDWAPWDLEHVSGATMEVKHYASVKPEKPLRRGWSGGPGFNIPSLRGYWTIDGSWIEGSVRPADIYILAWHPETGDSVDHRAPGQWRFFVIPTSVLPARQTNIGLPDLEQLTKAIGYEALDETVQKTLDDLRPSG